MIRAEIIGQVKASDHLFLNMFIKNFKSGLKITELTHSNESMTKSSVSIIRHVPISTTPMTI